MTDPKVTKAGKKTYDELVARGVPEEAAARTANKVKPAPPVKKKTTKKATAKKKK